MFGQPPASSRATAQSHGRQSMSLVDPEWELIDPTPDPRALFREFDKRFFWSKLACVEVRWSRQMTRCAGVCHYEGRGGLCSIRLSEPLLTLRPRKDLVQTLLHEMIHAYLFITCNNRDRDGHGPQFCEHMNRINRESGTNITIYHSFNNEVKFYQRHWWRCQGTCRDRPPFYGYVKRAMNRAPGPTDFWWAEHQRSCGGHYIKVKEPSQSEKAKPKVTGSSQKPAGADIRTFVAGSSAVDDRSGVSPEERQPFPSPVRTLMGDGGCILGGRSSVPPGNAPAFRVIPGVGRLPVRAGVNDNNGSDSRTVVSSLPASSVDFASIDGQTEAGSGGVTPKPRGKVSGTIAGKRKLPVSDDGATARKRDGTAAPGGQPHMQSQTKPSLPHSRPRAQVPGSPGRSTAAPPVHWGPIDRFVAPANGSSSQEQPVSSLSQRASAVARRTVSGDGLVDCPPDVANTARSSDSLVKGATGPANAAETRRGGSGSSEPVEDVTFLEPIAGGAPSRSEAVAGPSRRLASEIPQCRCPACGHDVALDVMNSHLDICITDRPAVSAAADTKLVQWGAPCPVCGERVEHALMNDHLDLCLSVKRSEFPNRSSSKTATTVTAVSAASGVKARSRSVRGEQTSAAEFSGRVPVVVDLTADELTAAELAELWANEPEDIT